MEEEEENQDTSIKGRLVALVNKLKGQPHKTQEKPTEKEQAIPCKNHLQQNANYHAYNTFGVYFSLKCIQCANYACIRVAVYK